MLQPRFLAVVTTIAFLLATSASYAQQGENLREAAQNPIADVAAVTGRLVARA